MTVAGLIVHRRDRKAIAEAKAEIAAGAKPRLFEDVCKEIGI